jgi:hypothetical protein
MDTYKKLIQIVIESQKEDILKELYFNKKNTTQKIDSIFYFINQIFSKLDKDLIIVFPSKKELSYLSAILCALNDYKKKFENILENFEKNLIPNCFVSYVSDDEENGKLYKYKGKSNYPDLIELETIPFGSNKASTISQKINLFQLCPLGELKNLNKFNIGKGKKFPPLNSDILLDQLLNIKSLGNPFFSRNKIISLTQINYDYEEFLKSKIITSKKINNKVYQNIELLTYGRIDQEGKVETKLFKNDNNKTPLNEKIEPLLLATSNINFLYNYLNQRKEDSIIFSDTIKKLQDNLTVFKQIKHLEFNHKFIIFAEEYEYETISAFSKANEIDVWKFEKSEIENLIEPFSINFETNIATDRFATSCNIYLEKKINYIDVGDDIFNNLDNLFNKFRSQISKEDEETKEIIKDILKPLQNLNYKLRDHIFGFPQKLIEESENNLNSTRQNFKSRENILPEVFIDNFNLLMSEFATLLEKKDIIFVNRINEFFKIINEDSNALIKSATLTYNPERKIYYQKNIEEKTNFKNCNIISSINSKRYFEKLIVPSEIISSSIEKLILSNQYKNICFLGGKKLQNRINEIEDNIFYRWSSFNLTKEKKCKILNMKDEYKNLLQTSEENRFFNKNKIVTNFNIENFLSSGDPIIKTELDENEDNNIDVTPVIFYGDAFSLVSDEFSIEVFNEYFEDLHSDNDPKVIRKNITQLETGDIIFIRGSSDKELVTAETINLIGNENSYNLLRNEANEWYKIISKCFDIQKDLKAFRNFINKINKNISKEVIKSAWNNSVTCPQQSETLVSILKACELKDINKYKFNIDEANKIFELANKLKTLRQQAGRNITTKIIEALKDKEKIEYDGNPIRLDYTNDGKLLLGNNLNSIPEAWIVTVQKIYKDKKKSKQSQSNKVLFS